MAKVFLITYDLRKPGQSYVELYEAIKSWRLATSTRIHMDCKSKQQFYFCREYLR